MVEKRQKCTSTSFPKSTIETICQKIRVTKRRNIPTLPLALTWRVDAMGAIIITVHNFFSFGFRFWPKWPTPSIDLARKPAKPTKAVCSNSESYRHSYDFSNTMTESSGGEGKGNNCLFYMSLYIRLLC